MKKPVFLIVSLIFLLFLVSGCAENGIYHNNKSSESKRKLTSAEMGKFSGSGFIEVNASSSAAKGNTVSNKIFGSHLEYFKEPDNVRSQSGYLNILKQLNCGMFRFPGGEDADNYLWKTKEVYRSDWFYTAADPAKDLGTDSFLSVCKETNAEPLIVINYDTGASQNNIEKVYNDAVDWAKYIKSKGSMVKYWEFGNEEFFPELSDKKQNVTPEAYAKQYLEMRKKLKAVDKDIMLGADMPPNWDSNEGWLTQNWAARFFAAAGKNVDFVTPHSYYSPSSDSSIVNNYYDLDKDVDSYKTGIKNAIGREIPVLVTEWNIECKNTVLAPGGIGNGVILAEGLMSLNRGGAAYACLWPLRWSFSSDEYWSGHSFGLVRDYTQKLTPAGQVFADMAGNIIGLTELKAKNDFQYLGVMDGSYISRDQKLIRIVLTNRDINEKDSIAVKIDGKTINSISGESIVSSTVKQGKQAEYTDISETSYITTNLVTDGSHIIVDLPPLSVTILTCNVK